MRRTTTCSSIESVIHSFKASFTSTTYTQMAILKNMDDN